LDDRLKYRALQREANDLYQAGKYQEVIDFERGVIQKFPELKVAIQYSSICAASKLEKYDLACDLLQEVLDEGGWYSEMILRQSPSLNPLQGMSEYEKLVNISMERFQKTSKNEHLTVFPDNTDPPFPLLLSLHAGGGFIEDEFESWKRIVDQGYVLGMPRSSSLFWSGKDSAYWPDYESTTKQIKAYINKLNVNKILDMERSILGGLSQGGGVAIRLALTGIFPVKSFVVVAPGGGLMDEPDMWQPLIEEAKDRELRGIIIRGEEDLTIPRDGLVNLVKLLNEGGIPCEFIEYPGLGHWYPPDIVDIVTSFHED
jgi:predicted esterase